MERPKPDLDLLVNEKYSPLDDILWSLPWISLLIIMIIGVIFAVYWKYFKKKTPEYGDFEFYWD